MKKRQFRYQPGQLVPGTWLRVIRPIGYGGMGAVYECEEIYTGNRYVLKVLHPELVAGKGMLARMEKEARTIAQLKHPNIVQIFWAGLTDESPKLFYYVMEKLEGYTVRNLYRKAIDRHIELRVDSVLRIMARLLQGLAHAHAKGVIHRDVKPDNVFVHKGGIIKLVDFGIAVQIEAAQTTAGGFVGTVGYAAPEQFQGKLLTAAADLWAVGVMTYELLTGRAPFGYGANEYALAQAILSVAPRPLMTIREDIPQELNDLVLRLLEKDPDKRPQDALQVAAEFERIRGELVQQSPLQPELTGPELMEAMGPPSITNVDQNLEEELPPPSDEPQSVQEPPPLNAPSMSPSAPAASAERLATDVLTPSAVNRVIGGPPQPAAPAGGVIPTQRSPNASPPANLADGASSPAAATGESCSDSSVPWAEALRLLGEGTTVQHKPLPENLALSLRDAATPACGVVPVRSGTEVVGSSPQVLRGEQGAAAVPERPSQTAAPRPAAPLTALVHAGTVPVRTVFQPFLNLDSTSAPSLQPNAAVQPPRSPQATPAAHATPSPQAAPAAQPPNLPHATPAAQPKPTPQTASATQPTPSPQAAPVVQPKATSQTKPGPQLKPDPQPRGLTPIAGMAPPAASAKQQPGLPMAPGGSERAQSFATEISGAPPVLVGAGANERPRERALIRPPSYLIDWDAPNPSPIPRSTDPLQPPLSDELSTLGSATNSLEPRAPASSSRRVFLLFLGSLAGALMVFGGIAAVCTAHRTSTEAAVASPGGSAIAATIPPPLASSSSALAESARAGAAPVDSPPASVSAASPVMPSAREVAVAEPVPQAAAESAGTPAEPGPPQLEPMAEAQPTSPVASASSGPTELVASAAMPQPHSTVSRQRIKPRPAAEASRERKRNDDPSSQVSTAEAASRDSEIIGLEFLARPKPKPTPNSASALPSAPIKPRPTAPGRGAP